MRIHPAADLFPMLSKAELDMLSSDIKTNGQVHPIVVWHDQILDGRNRSRACEMAGVEPKYKDVSEITEHDAIRFVVSCNILRRHLNESQRTMIAAELAKLKHGTNQHGGEDAQTCASTITQDQAADMMKVSRRSVQSARKIQEAAPELVAGVKSGTMSVNKAAGIARQRIKAQTDPNLAADSVIDASEKRAAEGDTMKARAVLAAVARLDPTELTFIRPDLLRILGVAP